MLDPSAVLVNPLVPEFSEVTKIFYVRFAPNWSLLKVKSAASGPGIPAYHVQYLLSRHLAVFRRQYSHFG